MNKTNDDDFGPLKDLIGVWVGKDGIDIAPEPDGTETNPYFETITYTAVGDLSNAETQNLMAIHYHQIVQRKSTGDVFHDETGYWIWDREAKTIMHSLTIPRGVCVLAGGKHSGHKENDNRTVLKVQASIDHINWTIIQSPFMQEKATTTKFTKEVIVGNGKLSYTQTIMLKIYGKVFEHTDQNELVLKT